MRKGFWLAVALVMVAGCGAGEAGKSVAPEVAAWCADFCRESRTGACWSAEDGGPDECVANCEGAAPDAERRETCAFDPEDENPCEFFYVCMDLAPHTTQAAHWQEACTWFCEGTADCRDPGLADRDACIARCVSVAPWLETEHGTPVLPPLHCPCHAREWTACAPLFSAD